MIHHIDIPKKYQKLKCSNSRKVIMAVLENDLKQYKNKKVLEIGCGDWDFVKKIVEKNGNEWTGIDAVPSKITDMIGGIDILPFKDKTFDIVICIDVLEHIYEYDVSFQEALTEINRVLKVGGVLIATAPIHLHGHPYFLFGKVKTIRRIIARYFGTCITFQHYNKKEKRWRRIASKGFFSHFGYPDFLFKKDAFTNTIFIYSQKQEECDYELVNESLFRKSMMIIRFVKELIFS